MPHARERRGRRKLCSAKFIGMLSAKSAVTLKGPRVVARASRNQPQSQRTDLTQSAREAAMSARLPLVGLSLWKRQSPASVHRTETLRCRFWRTMHLPRSGNEIQLLSEQAISLSTRWHGSQRRQRAFDAPARRVGSFHPPCPQRHLR